MAASPGSHESTEVYRPTLVKGRYRITDVIHRGRRGDVVAAYDVHDARRVVLKRLPDPDRTTITRLRTAHRVFSGLEHPNVARTFDLIETRTDAWLVSEQAVGLELDAWWDTLPLSSSSGFADRWRHAAPIVAALVDGLEAIHRRQLAHLDLKPVNVRVDVAGRAVIVGVGMGAPPDGIDGRTQAEIRRRDGYLAPELLDGLSTSRLADQWSLGALIYELLTGQKAVPGETPAEVAKSYRVGKVQPIREWRPETDPALEDVVLRMLSWAPESRFASITAAREALGSHLVRATVAPDALWSIAPPPAVGLDALDAFFRRRLIELRGGSGCVVRIADVPESGKTMLLERWLSQARDEGEVTVLGAACVPSWPRSALHGWFQPPSVDPRHPPPPDLVDQAIAQIGGPAVVLLDTLEEVDTLVWARIQRAAAVAATGSGAHPLLLVLAGRALAPLEPSLPQGHPRLFNVTMPRLGTQDVRALLRPESDDEEDCQVVDLVAESLARDARGIAGKVIRACLAEAASHRMRRDGRLWVPVVGSANFDTPQASMPVSWPQVRGYVEELGPWVEVELVLAALPMGRQILLDALHWAEREGAIVVRQTAGRWLLATTPAGTIGVPAELHALHATHSRAGRWLERNGEFDGLAAERTARHWSQAGEFARAADAYIRAAKAHSAVGSSSEARRLAQLSRTFEQRRTGNTTPGTNPLARMPG